MHLVKKLLKSDYFILIPIILFAALRFPSLFEPYWYGDEGIYQAIGIAMNNGRELYAQIWDNKPPLLYLIYALAGGNQYIVRLFSLIVGIFTVIVFFHLSKKVLRQTVSAVATLLFTILFGSAFLEGNIANAENFMLLPILLGMLLIYNLLTKRNVKVLKIENQNIIYLITGLLLGISFSLKIVGVFEYLAATLLLLLSHFSKEKRVKSWLFLTGGFLIPISTFMLFFITNGNIQPFLESVFFSNVSYVGYENFLLIPQGFLVLKLLILASCIFLILKNRKKIPQNYLFILIWTTFALFSSFFSQRSYTHYLLLSLPPIILLGAMLLSEKHKYFLFILGYGALIVFLFFHFKPYPFIKTFAYYPHYLAYQLGKIDKITYQKFFDNDVPRDYAVAEYLKMKLNTNDPVFIWGNSAQIYALSKTLPIGRYTVAYHIQNDEQIKETITALKAKNPRFVVLLNDTQFKNIPLNNYAYLLTIEGAAIYEKTN